MAVTFQLQPAEYYIDELDELKSRRGEAVDELFKLGDAIQALQSLAKDISKKVDRLDSHRTYLEMALQRVEAPPTQ